jgi:hypothetical protein
MAVVETATLRAGPQGQVRHPGDREEMTDMSDVQHEAYEDRRTALAAASNALRVSREDLTGRPEETAAAVVALADLIHAGYFPGSPLITSNAAS